MLRKSACRVPIPDKAPTESTVRQADARHASPDCCKQAITLIEPGQGRVPLNECNRDFSSTIQVYVLAFGARLDDPVIWEYVTY